MTIGEAAKRAGVTTKTVRYYEQIGLLPHPSRTDAGYRRYGEDELARLRFIGRAKGLGLSLEEIGGILALSAAGADPCPHVVGLLDQHLARIEETLARLADFREQLARLRADAERATKGRVCGIMSTPRSNGCRSPSTARSRAAPAADPRAEGLDLPLDGKPYGQGKRTSALERAAEAPTREVTM